MLMFLQIASVLLCSGVDGKVTIHDPNKLSSPEYIMQVDPADASPPPGVVMKNGGEVRILVCSAGMTSCSPPIVLTIEDPPA
jgi:hypothetical protein